MRKIRPWLRNLMIIDAIVFVLGMLAIIPYAASSEEWWLVGIMFVPAAIVVVICAGLYWWQTRGPN